MFGAGLNIFNIEENKVTTNLNQYPIILMSLSGDGKTTTMNNILRQIAPKDKAPLFIMFEDRFQHIPGILAVRVRNMAELETIKGQLLTEQAKERFSSIVIDTLDKADDMISAYVATSKGVDITGDIGFGKGNQYVKSSGGFIRDLKNFGYCVHYVVQADKVSNFATGKIEAIPKVNKELWKTAYTDAYLCGFLQVDTFKGTRTMTFRKTENMPLLKDSIGMPDKVEVEGFDKTLLASIEKMAGGKLTSEDTIVSKIEDKRDFGAIKAEVKKLGGQLYEKGFGADCTLVMAQVLGANEDGSTRSYDTIVPAQIDLMEVLCMKLRGLANSKGIE